MDSLVMKSGGWLLLAAGAVCLIRFSAVGAFSVQLGIVAAAAMIALVATMRGADWNAIAAGAKPAPADQGRYDDDIVRKGVIATLFWGVAGLGAGLFIALQLTWPALNLGFEY